MYAALITDTTWLNDERATLKSLIVGLIGEQVRVAQVVPTRIAHDVPSPFVAHVIWQDSGREWLRQHRLAGLEQQLDDLRLTVLHALDGRLWSGALRLAERLDLPVVLNVNAAADLDRAAKLQRRIAACRVAFSAATTPLGEAVRDLAPASALVDVIPFGTHVATQPNQPPLDGSLCVVVTGNGMLDEYYQALFAALESFVKQVHGSLFFFDGLGGDQHTLWKAARRHRLLPQVSMVPAHLNRRDLLLGAHLLIHPQPLGRARSLTLQAMTYGLTVLAHRDPWLDYLIDDTTAWLIDPPKPDRDAWLSLLRRTTEQPQAIERLHESARQWVRAHHLAATHVERTMRLYRQLTGESYSFDAMQETTEAQ